MLMPKPTKRVLTVDDLSSPLDLQAGLHTKFWEGIRDALVDEFEMNTPRPGSDPGKAMGNINNHIGRLADMDGVEQLKELSRRKAKLTGIPQTLHKVLSAGMRFKIAQGILADATSRGWEVQMVSPEEIQDIKLHGTEGMPGYSYHSPSLRTRPTTCQLILIRPQLVLKQIKSTRLKENSAIEVYKRLRKQETVAIRQPMQWIKHILNVRLQIRRLIPDEECEADNSKVRGIQYAEAYAFGLELYRKGEVHDAGDLEQAIANYGDDEGWIRGQDYPRDSSTYRRWFRNRFPKDTKGEDA